LATLLYVRTGSAGTDPDVNLYDLGIVVPTSASWTLLSASLPNQADAAGGQFTAIEIRDSRDLFLAISSGALEWSVDGANVELAADYRADYMLTEDFTDDSFIVNNLTVSGIFTVSGYDLTGHLDGGPNKHDASEIDVEGTYSNIPVAPADLETVISGINVALGTAASFAFGTINGDTGSAIADVGSDTISITGAGSITTTATDNPETLSIDGSALLPRDGSRPMTGTLNLAGNSVVSGLNATFTGAVDLSGATSFKIPQATDVSTSFPGGTEGDLAWDTDDEVLYAHNGTQWFGLAPASGIITDHGGLTGLLDDDHPQYALLGGNAARNVVSGVFDFTTGEIILPVDVSAPAGVDGKTSVIGGILYTYDGTRSKWLSVERTQYIAAKNGNANDIYLRFADAIPSSETGVRIMRNATIVGLFAQTDVNETWILEVRRNGVVTVLTSLTMTGVSGNQATNINVDLAAGDELQLFANTTGNIKSPIAGIEIAWRV
jgi:hypothetical protein